jgi:hypothetical protein
MTVRVTTLKGADAGAYYVEQLPNYYLQSGEPRGVWLGDGAPMLGLAGELDDDDFLALMAGMDPQRPDRHLGRRYDDSRSAASTSPLGTEVGVVLFALGDDDVRREVLDAHDARSPHSPDWIERHAHTRYRIGGEVAVVDAEGIVAACSGSTRAAPSTRSSTPTSSSPTGSSHPTAAGSHSTPALIKRDQRTLSALYHAGLRAELTQRLGVRWRTPENGIAEMADVPESLLPSSRAAPTRCAAASTPSSTASSTRWAATRPHGSGGDSNAKPCSTAAPARKPNVDAAALHDEWREQARATRDGTRGDRGRRRRTRSFSGTRSTSTSTTADRRLGDRRDQRAAVELATRRAPRELAALLPDRDRGRGRRRSSVGRLTSPTTIAADRCVDISAPDPTRRAPARATADRSPSRPSTER